MVYRRQKETHDDADILLLLLRAVPSGVTTANHLPASISSTSSSQFSLMGFISSAITFRKKTTKKTPELKYYYISQSFEESHLFQLVNERSGSTSNRCDVADHNKSIGRQIKLSVVFACILCNLLFFSDFFGFISIER